MHQGVALDEADDVVGEIPGGFDQGIIGFARTLTETRKKKQSLLAQKAFMILAGCEEQR